MSRFVVDANVAIKWYLPEVHDAPARRLLTGAHELLAPDLIYSEVGNILWKRFRAGEMTEEEVEAVMHSFGALPLAITPSWPLVLPAMTIACQTDRSVYDSLYLALAIREGVPMVTADEKFTNALKTTPIASSLLWVEDIPE
jgi:predicted nucleic acid-binding protein